MLNNNKLVAQGVPTCAGCGLEIAIRNILDLLGEETIIVIPPGCAALFSGFGNSTNLRIPGFQGNLGNTAAYASGIRAGLDLQGDYETTVVAFAGDGATADIGLQALSAMFERGDRILYICYDNEAYMNTGIQGSSTTSKGAITTTTPEGKSTTSKNMIDIASAHKIPYIASASIAYLKDLRKKIIKAKNAEGPSYVHIHIPCPTGWLYDPKKTIEIGQLAVESGAWTLCEIEHGKKQYNFTNIDTSKLKKYFNQQKRFKNLTANSIDKAEENIKVACNLGV